MKTVQKFIIALLLMTSLFFMYLIQHQHSTVRLHENSSIDPEVSKLLDLITLQNKTILLLQTQLSKESAKRDENKNILHENHLQSPLTKLTIEEDKPIVRSIQENEIPTVSSSSSIITSHELNSKFESECDGKYGEAFISNWRDSKQIWCEDETSSLICYPYHQAHKKLDGRGPDLFCEARDFVIDFAKVSSRKQVDDLNFKF